LHSVAKLTSWSWALLEKPPVAQLLKDLLTCYGTRRFITVFTRALQWSLSWARSIQSISPHPISLRSSLLLYSHLCLVFPSGFTTKVLYVFLFLIPDTTGTTRDLPACSIVPFLYQISRMLPSPFCVPLGSAMCLLTTASVLRTPQQAAVWYSLTVCATALNVTSIGQPLIVRYTSSCHLLHTNNDARTWISHSSLYTGYPGNKPQSRTCVSVINSEMKLSFHKVFTNVHFYQKQRCSSTEAIWAKHYVHSGGGSGFETRWGELIFWMYLILPVALGPGVHSASNRNEYQKHKNNNVSEE
jgi:hypothetical protein